jgi:hypothetical protein
MVDLYLTAEAVFRTTSMDKRLEKMTKSARLPWPIDNFKYIEAYKKRMKMLNLKDAANYHQKERAYYHLRMTGMGMHGYITQTYSKHAGS